MYLCISCRFVIELLVRLICVQLLPLECATMANSRMDCGVSQDGPLLPEIRQMVRLSSMQVVLDDRSSRFQIERGRHELADKVAYVRAVDDKPSSPLRSQSLRTMAESPPLKRSG